MSPRVQCSLRTAIIFLLTGLRLGAWMLMGRELAGAYSGPRLISAHTHVIPVGFVMMMILGVALAVSASGPGRRAVPPGPGSGGVLAAYCVHGDALCEQGVIAERSGAAASAGIPGS